MEGTCRKLIQECKEERKSLSKKQKEIAKSFISGYANDKPEPKVVPEAQPPTINWWKMVLACVKDTCTRFFKRR